MNRRFAIMRHIVIFVGIIMIVVCLRQASAAAGCILSGTIADSLGQPLEGVSVSVFPQGGDTLVVISDSLGFYSLTLAVIESLPASMRVTAVGYLPSVREIIIAVGELRIDFTLVPTAIPIRGIEVISEAERDWFTKRVSSDEVRTAAMRSVVPSNPLAAVVVPQLARIGPSLSAMYRVDGSVPQYYLDGLSLGADPAHFGMFSHLPLQAIDQIRISAEGTEASRGSPSCVDLSSIAQFEPHHRGEVQVSLIDGTVWYSRGGNRSFASVTMRRSVIDQLAQRIDLGSSRQTIPDPTFQDVVLTSGVRLSRHFRWLATGYYSWDRLGYQLGSWGSTGYANDIWSQQSATERYLGSSLLGQFGEMSTTAAVGIRSTSRHYRAFIPDSPNPNDLNVDLTENSLLINSLLKLEWVQRRTEYSVGWQMRSYARLNTDLEHEDWNLLSPFAHSNDVYCYQTELNDIYGNRELSLRPTAHAWFGSAIWRTERISFENGVRLEYFGGLDRPMTVGTRHRLAVRVGRGITADAGIGRYYESPISGALESYQVPIRAGLKHLIPVNTTVLSGRIQSGWFSVDISRRLIRNLPNMTPDFDHRLWLYQNGHYVADPEFLTMRSIGRIQTTTLAVTLQTPRPLWGSLKPSASYARSRSRQAECSVWTPYDLDSPHRWTLQLDFSPPGRLSLGARWQYHTGYPYTPDRGFHPVQYSASWYARYRSQANSERFQANISFDVYGQYSRGRWTLFASVANLTNHANEMIRGAREFVYDAGLLPNVGVRCRF